MTDPIIKQLNNRLAEKIANVKPAGTDQMGGMGGVSKFDMILNQKQETSSMEKLGQVVNNEDFKKSDMEVLSAEDIKINIANSEFGQTTNFSGKNAVSELFSTINNDTLKMDSIVEVLSSSETKLSRRQLLAYQASIGTLTINTELFSKLAQSLSQNINTVLQTNMG